MVTVDEKKKEIQSQSAKTKTSWAGEPRSRIIIYDDNVVWQATIPTAELGSLPITSRWIPDIGQQRRAGMFMGVVLSTLLVWAVFSVMFQGIHSAILLAFAAVIAAPLGVIVGWYMGPAIGSKPFYIIRRKLNPETKTYDIQPVMHTYLLEEMMHRYQANESNGDGKTVIPGIYLGTSWYSNVEARAVRRLFTIPTSSTMQKIQIGGLVVIAGCMVVVIFFLAAIVNGG